VCVFCGSSIGAGNAYADVAASLGRELAARGIGLVYGGSGVGLMRVVAQACRTAGGSVTGVIPESLVEAEVADRELDDLRIVGTMQERKAQMAELAAGFVALPGGFGTFEEFCEVVTWSQLGLHVPAKPCALLDVDGFYSPLLELFERAVAEGFIRPEHRRLVLAASDPAGVLDLLAAWEPPPTRKWVDGPMTPDRDPARPSAGSEELEGRDREVTGDGEGGQQRQRPERGPTGDRQGPGGAADEGQEPQRQHDTQHREEPGQEEIVVQCLADVASQQVVRASEAAAGGAVDTEQHAAGAQRVDPAPRRVDQAYAGGGPRDGREGRPARHHAALRPFVRVARA
jgi:uncharacterized protein (TIGR00730 family)